MPSRFGESLKQYDAGVHSAAAVVPSDSVDLVSPTTRVYVGVSGALAVIFCDDPDSGSVVLTGLAAGVWHQMQVRRILATGTTATGIVAGI